MPTNHVLARLASMSGNRKTVSGSMLVVKQQLSAENTIIDINKDEMKLINFLLSK
jgi:hypothetical protein